MDGPVNPNPPSVSRVVRPSASPPSLTETSPALRPSPARSGPLGHPTHLGQAPTASPGQSEGRDSAVTPLFARVIQLDLVQVTRHQRVQSDNS